MEQAPVKTKARRTIPWHPMTALAVVGLLYLIPPTLSQLILSIYPAIQGWSMDQAVDWLNSSVYTQFGFYLLTEVLIVVGLLLFLRAYKRKLIDLGFRKPRWLNLGQGIAAYPVYLIMFLAAVVLVEAFVPAVNINQEQQIGFDDVAGFWPLLVTFISLVVLAPLVEELLFRGYLFTSLRDKLTLPISMVITSIVFAIAHLPAGGEAGPLYIAAVDTFLLSLVLCWLREKTSSLWPCITLHALKNGIAYCSLFIFTAG